MDQRAGEGRLLLEVALQLGSTLELDRLLRLVIEKVAALVDAERALFALTDREARIRRAVVHNLEWAGPGHPLPVSHGVIARAIRDRKPVLVGDASMDEELQRRQSVQLLGLRLVVAVPVPAHDRIIGVLYVDSRVKTVPETAEKIEVLTALARLVGTAVENAELFEEQRFRTMLLAQLVHDFKTPLAVIGANASLLAERGGETGEIAADIDASARRMAHMIGDTLELSRIDAGAPAPVAVAVDLAPAVRRHVAAFDALLRQRGLELVVEAAPDVPPAHTVADRVWIILDNLLFNALNHATAGTAIRIDVGLRDDGGPPEARDRLVDASACLFQRVSPLVPLEGSRFVEIAVRNEGRPIPAELVPRLFEAYVRGDERPSAGSSSGLGLSIVDQCARHLGGLVWMEAAGASTTFRFTLPTRLAIPAT